MKENFSDPDSNSVRKQRVADFASSVTLSIGSGFAFEHYLNLRSLTYGRDVWAYIGAGLMAGAGVYMHRFVDSFNAGNDNDEDTGGGGWEPDPIPPSPTPGGLNREVTDLTVAEIIGQNSPDEKKILINA